MQSFEFTRPDGPRAWASLLRPQQSNLRAALVGVGAIIVAAAFRLALTTVTDSLVGMFGSFLFAVTVAALAGGRNAGW
jgi:hypothetical protein